MLIGHLGLYQNGSGPDMKHFIYVYSARGASGRQGHGHQLDFIACHVETTQ